MSFEIDPRLRRDCHILGRTGDSFVLLMDNALFPWIILVPVTEHSEFHELGQEQQLQLLQQINRVSNFILKEFDVTKINTACIGNIVRQLHIHLIGRHELDACWPGVVWGTEHRRARDMKQVKDIQRQMQRALGEDFTAL